MEDNTSSDDEVKDPPCNAKTGGKKLKLNDGSALDTFLRAVASSSKDENVDSGVSADKSESTSSDDKGAGTSEDPSNELVSIAPSCSNVQAILVNFRRPRRGRNYRKRKTPERDTDSNASTRDSDDLSAEDASQPTENDNSNSETDSDDMTRFMDLGSAESEIAHSGSSSTLSDTYESNETDEMVRIQEDATDSDEAGPTFWSGPHDSQAEADEDKGKLPDVLSKQRPKHNFVILKEIMHREMGLTFPSGKTTNEDVMFERRFYGSLHAVYRLKKLHSLYKHKGCVNSINFHPKGDLLVSGSDDMKIVIWDWAKNIAVQTMRTGHKSNVFQSKFLYLNAQSQLNIVTCARDGQVRLMQCPAAGGAGTRRRLCTHARAAHKLHVSAAEPHLVLSAGEDGLVMQCDVRADRAGRLLHVKEKNMTIPLYSVHGHPLEARELVVAGRDKFIRVYDRRKSTRPLELYCPNAFIDAADTKKKARISLTHLTCAVYNHDGSEILGSYNDEDIYLFNTKADAYNKEAAENIENLGYTYKFSGHRNSATFKGVAFFGPNSEYVVSGSDCSHIYIWHKKTESIVQWLPGDTSGVVNCMEAHPRHPVLATSGLDRDVKIWIPQATSDPKFAGLEKVVRENGVSQLRSPLFNDFLPTLYNAWSSHDGDTRFFTDDENGSGFGGNIEFDGNVCTTF